MTYKKLIIIVLILLAAFAGFLAYRSYSSNKSDRSNKTNEANTTLLRQDFAGQANTSNKTDAVSAPSAESKIYNNPDHNFSLELLPGLTTTAFEEGDGDVVLIGQDKSYKTDTTNEPNKSNTTNKSNTSYSSYEMQITIRPFDEETSLTAARIQKEVPEIKMQNAVAVKADGTDAVSFVSCSPSSPSEERMPAGQERLNCFREIWFVQNRELYQIIAPSSFDNVTGKLMESWKWN